MHARLSSTGRWMMFGLSCARSWSGWRPRFPFLRPGQPTLRPESTAQAIRVLEQFASYTLRIGKAVGAVVGQDVPHGDQELASDGHNGLALAQARFEPSQLCSPVRVSAGCGVGYFYHGGPDVTAAGFGDVSGVMGLAAVVDASSQARWPTSCSDL